MTEPEKFERYTKALDEARETIDRARIRASEISGAAKFAGHENPTQAHLTINSALDIESKKLKASILDIHDRLDKIRFKRD